MCLIIPSPVIFILFFFSFESFSSISGTRLYSNAITQGIKGTSIIWIAHLSPFKALKDGNLKQTIDISVFVLTGGKCTPGICYCDEKFLWQMGEESIHLYFHIDKLHFVGTDDWMDGAALNKANKQPGRGGPIEFSSS